MLNYFYIFAIIIGLGARNNSKWLLTTYNSHNESTRTTGFVGVSF